MRGGLSQTDVALDYCIERQRPEMLAHLGGDLVVQAVAHVHRQHESFDFERGVQAALDDLDRVEQLREPFERQVFALHGNQHRVGGREDVDGGVSQRGRAVDEHVVVVVAHLRENPLDDVVALFHFRKFGVGRHQIDARRQQPQPFDVLAAKDHLRGAACAGDAFVDALGIDVEAQARRGVGLRVGVEQQHLLAENGQRSGQIDRRRGLSHAAFLVCECDDFCHS